MDFGKFFGKTLIVKLAKTVVEDALIPAAQEYVQSTDNPYDNMLVAGLTELAQKLLSDAAGVPVIVAKKA